MAPPPASWRARRLEWSDLPLADVATPAGPMRLTRSLTSGLTRREGDPPGVFWGVGDRGPNIKPLPINAPPADEIVAKIALKALDNVSTDDITPADAQLSSMRSNIPLIAQYAFSRYAPEFVPRIRDLGAGFIVAGENYGQGSSREHAAITPMFWGIKAVIAKSFARIHRNNLVNHGVLPLVFEDPKDYERVALLDTLRISGAPEQIRSGHIELENLDKGFSFFARLEVSFDEREILLCGGLLPYMKRAIGSKGD